MLKIAPKQAWASNGDVKVLEVIRELKTYKNLFEKVLEESNLKLAMEEAADKKRDRKDVQEILSNKDFHTKEIQKILRGKLFIPQYVKCRKIREGTHNKEREIYEPRFAYDLVIQHAVAQVLMPIFMKGMDPHSYSSIKGRGAFKGKEAVEKWIRNDHKNTKYCLKADIHHFYASVDQEILIAQFARIIKDENMMWLIHILIREFDSGLPIGYYSSVWFGAFYLQGLDHYIREEIRVSYYARYADDISIFGNNKKKLHRARESISKYVEEQLHLELKSDWQVFRMDYIPKKQEDPEKPKHKGRALDFMGFVFYRDRTVLREGIMLRATRKARKISKKAHPTWYDGCQITCRLGYFKHTDTRRCFDEHVKAYVNIKLLKKLESRHQRRLNSEENRMAEGKRLRNGQTENSGFELQSDNGLSQ